MSEWASETEYKREWNKIDLWEQDKSSYIEQQPPIGDRKYSNTLPKKRGKISNRQEHHKNYNLDKVRSGVPDVRFVK